MHAVLADRSGGLAADILDDGTRANWLRLCGAMIAQAADDLVAVTYPELATSYLSTWFGSLCEARRLERVAQERQQLEAYCFGEGAEWADWLDLPDYVAQLRRTICRRLPGESPARARKRLRAARERVKKAFLDYAGKSEPIAVGLILMLSPLVAWAQC